MQLSNGYTCVFQGKSDEALERHLVDLRAQNAELISSGNLSGSGRMQSALSAALRLASLLSSDQSQDTILQAMAVLDSVNKKLYGMIEQSADSSKSEPQQSGEVRQSTTSRSLDSVRQYGDSDDDYLTMDVSQFGYDVGRQQSSLKRPSPSRPAAVGASSLQQRSAAGPSKRFHFGL